MLNLTFFKINFVSELSLDPQRHTFSVVHVSVTNCLFLTHFNKKNCLYHAPGQLRNEENKQDEWDISCSVTVEVNMKALQKSRNRPAILSVLLLASYLTDSKWTNHRNICRSMFNAVPLTITRRWSQSRWVSLDECLKKMCSLGKVYLMQPQEKIK